MHRFEDKKNHWRNEFLINIQRNLTNPSAQADAFNARESLKKRQRNGTYGKYNKFNATELFKALKAVDRGDFSNYEFDRGRYRNTLMAIGISEDRLQSMTLSDILIYDAAIFEATFGILQIKASGKIAEAFAVYNDLFEKFPEHREFLDQNRQAFQADLESMVLPVIQDNNYKAPAILMTQSPKWLILGAGLLGAAVGVALTMTGIFAPFGISIATIAVTGIVAAVIGGAVTALFDRIYQKSTKISAVDQLPGSGEVAHGRAAQTGSSHSNITHSLMAGKAHRVENSDAVPIRGKSTAEIVTDMPVIVPVFNEKDADEEESNTASNDSGLTRTSF